MGGVKPLNSITCIARIAYSAALLLAKPANLWIFSICSGSVQKCQQYRLYCISDCEYSTQYLWWSCIYATDSWDYSTHSCPHPSQREEESACHTTTDESSLRSTIIVLLVLSPIMSMWTSSYHVQKARLVMEHSGVAVTWLFQSDQILPQCVKVWHARLTRDLGS